MAGIPTAGSAGDPQRRAIAHEVPTTDPEG
jgi:hypothetical protein